MKKVFALALVVLLGASVSEAQLVKSRTFGSVEKEKKDYNRISVGYDAQFFTGDIEESITANGFNVMYNHGFALTSSAPLFLELGFGLGYNSGKHTEKVSDRYKYEGGISNFWLKVPVNLAYRAKLTDNISLLPYTGINFKINGTLDAKDTEYDYYYDEKDTETWSFFDDEMGGKRFQMGWQIGVGVNISKLYLGIQYGIDFLPAVKNVYDYKINSSNLAVNLGYTW